MALIEFKDKPSTDTPINSANLNNNFDYLKDLIESMWPIGRGFIDFTNTDYSNWLGFTWERTLVGRTPVGIDSDDTDFNTVGKTGGEKEHTLTVSEMPSHKHELSLADYESDLCSAVVWKQGNSNGIYAYGGDMIDFVGEDQAHNNLQPYQVVAFWKRIA